MEEQNVMTDAQLTKFQADNFYMSANILLEEEEVVRRKIVESNFNSRLTDEERDKMFLALPAHCLYAFCSELYMKCLIQARGGTYDKIHYLDDLFNVLDEDLQQEIFEEYGKIYNHDFLEMLREHRKDFEIFRYANEKTGGIKLLSFAKWLADILAIVADKHVEKFVRK